MLCQVPVLSLGDPAMGSKKRASWSLHSSSEDRISKERVMTTMKKIRPCLLERPGGEYSSSGQRRPPEGTFELRLEKERAALVRWDLTYWPSRQRRKRKEGPEEERAPGQKTKPACRSLRGQRSKAETGSLWVWGARGRVLLFTVWWGTIHFKLGSAFEKDYLVSYENFHRGTKVRIKKLETFISFKSRPWEFALESDVKF